MKVTTLKEYADSVHTKEKMAKEEKAASEQIEDFASSLYFALGKCSDVKILTDYDCDGITSAFIMNRLVNAAEPDMQVEVICNDRRGSYGLPPDVKGQKGTMYIILDMGSNQLDYIKNTFGIDNVFMADHHLVENKADAEEILKSKNLLNLHTLHEDDSENAQYCTAGLAYRVYRELYNKASTFNKDVRRDNTVAVMAAIGTVGDVVDLLDMNSFNRSIVQNGMKRIDASDENTLEFPIGYMFGINGIGSQNITSKQIAFNVVSYINAASRMSDYINCNGAQRMYNAITGDPRRAETYFTLDDFVEVNTVKKEMCASLQGSSYFRFLKDEIYSDKTCLVYPINASIRSAFVDEKSSPKVLHSMAGILAGRISEATDKAALCLVYHSEGDYWSGSGRNAEGNESLKGFIDEIMKTDECRGIEIEYGGHEDAIGISKLKGYDSFGRLARAIEAHSELMKKREGYEKTYLKMSAEEMKAPETFEILEKLQPIGNGNTIPPVMITGELRRERKDSLIAKNPHWVKREIDTDTGRVTVKDWNYSPENFVTDEKARGKFIVGSTTFVASLDVNSYMGRTSIELTRKTDMEYYRERTLALVEEKNNIPIKKNTKKSDKGIEH